MKYIFLFSLKALDNNIIYFHKYCVWLPILPDLDKLEPDKDIASCR